jgi:hypothetical protein
MPSQWNVFAITLEVVGGTQQEKNKATSHFECKKIPVSLKKHASNEGLY